MALNTSSQITPEERPDLDWFEREALKKIHSHLEKALKAKKWELALSLLSELSPRTLRYAKGFYFQTGLDDLGAIRKLLEEYIPKMPADDNEAKKNVMALVDTWAAIAQNFFLETLRRMRTFDKELKEFFAKDDWSPAASKDLPAFLQIEILYLQDSIAFEQKMEQRRLSRPKYLQQLAVKALLVNYSTIVQTITKFETEELPSFIRKIVNMGYLGAATQVTLSTLHANWKLPGWYSDLDRLFQSYAEYQKYEDEMYQLPTLDFETLQAQFQTQREELLEMLTNKKSGAYLFASRSHDSNQPDHFGQTYFILANECLDALDRNDEETLESVFQTFFALAFMSANMKFTDANLYVNQEFRLHLISTANKDIVTLLGYSILYSEHYGNEKLQTVPMNIWNNLLETVTDRKGYLERTLQLSDSNSFSMSASPRDHIRSEWKMKFESHLREQGYEDRFSSLSGNRHPSPIVEVFRGGYYDASNVFFALHVLDEIDLPKKQIKHQISDFRAQLARRQEEQE